MSVGSKRCWRRLAWGVVVAVAAMRATSAAAQVPGAGVTIEGRVVDAYPGATPRPDVVIYNRMDGPPVPDGGRAPIRPDRTFLIENIEPGRYEIYANYSVERHRVTVGEAGLTGVEVVVTGLRRIGISARMDDGSDLPADGRVSVHLAPLRTATLVLGKGPGILLPPGEHWLLVTPPEGTFLQSMTSGDIDLRRRTLRVEPGEEEAIVPVEIVFTRTEPADVPVTTITGETGQPGLEVDLLELRGSLQPVFVAGTTTDAAGGFRFDDVRPGLYRINLPPAERVVDELVVGAEPVSLGIPVGAGAQVVAGAPIFLHFDGKAMVLMRPTTMTLVAEGEGATTRIPLEYRSFWHALAPGAYRLRLEDVEPGFSVRSMRAGSVDLLTEPFVVPVDHPAERIEIHLDYTMGQ